MLSKAKHLNACPTSLRGFTGRPATFLRREASAGPRPRNLGDLAAIWPTASL